MKILNTLSNSFTLEVICCLVYVYYELGNYTHVLKKLRIKDELLSTNTLKYKKAHKSLPIKAFELYQFSYRN